MKSKKQIRLSLSSVMIRGLALLTTLLFEPLAAAELKPAALFSDHMVLQRGQPVPVWGQADPGEQVSVSISGQTKSTTTDAHGKWLVRLDPMPASPEGHELVVQSSDEKRRFRIIDVVVGDVWLCSGQSNMLFRMNKVENSQKEIAAANDPNVRFFAVKEQFAQSPLTQVGGAWKPISPATAAECSAVAYYFATSLQKQLGVPIGLLVSSVGGTRIETWMPQETLVSLGDSQSLLEKWKHVSTDEFSKIAADYRAYQYRRDRPLPVTPTATDQPAAPARSAAEKPPSMRCHDCPGALHNGMIAPLQPFAIRGFLWYQGEANSGRPDSYEKLLPGLIADWRKVWGQTLPFLFVQLAPFKSTHPAFREAQLRIWQKTPHSAMVVTTDVGDANDIHPVRKRPVGERLALAARALSYGEKVEYSGPVFKNMSIENDRAVISFTHIGAGLVAKGDSLTGFTMAGGDGKFIAARAVIEGSTVVITSDKITQPVAVRYAWATVPDGNLFNREGLPAAPFRSDLTSAVKPNEKSQE